MLSVLSVGGFNVGRALDCCVSFRTSKDMLRERHYFAYDMHT